MSAHEFLLRPCPFFNLNYDQILNLLNEGYACEFDIHSDDDLENELEILLRNFGNDDLYAYLETIWITVKETKWKLSGNWEDNLKLNQEHNIEANENSINIVTLSTIEFRCIKKKNWMDKQTVSGTIFKIKYFQKYWSSEYHAIAECLFHEIF